MISRRTLLSIAASFAAPARGFAGDAWKDRKPEQWSPQDVERLITKSPWAKEVTLTYSPGGGAPGGGGGRRRGGGQWDGGGGGGGGGMSRGGGGGGGWGGSGRSRDGDESLGAGQQRPQSKAVVRWESALPIRAATKQQMPPSAAGQYVISVSGAQFGNWVDPHNLTAVTSLQAKGTDPIAPDKVGRSGPALVFYFPKGDHPFSMDDKEVIFATRLGPMEIKARFPLKDMQYDGRLEL